MSQRRGNYSMLMGSSIFAILGFSALAVDISLITMAEQQAQATADAASHAALIAFRKALPVDAEQEAEDAADFIITRNPVAMGVATRKGMEYGIYDFSATGGFNPGYSPSGHINAIQVEVAREAANAVDLLLAPMFGVSQHNVDARSITAQQRRAVMLVQDFSCSMQDGGCVTGSCAIDDARRANFSFLQYLTAFPQDGDLIGLAGYATEGLHEDGSATLSAVDPTWATLSSIASDLPYLTEKFSTICHTEQGCPVDALTFTTPIMIGPLKADIGNLTNPSIAMNMATNQLDLASDETDFRAMLLFSDGTFNEPGTDADADAAAVAAANLAWDDYDIHIWTILLGTTVDEVQMQSLVRGLGFYQNGAIAADLPTLYQNVAKSLPTALVD